MTAVINWLAYSVGVEGGLPALPDLRPDLHNLRARHRLAISLVATVARIVVMCEGGAR